MEGSGEAPGMELINRKGRVLGKATESGGAKELCPKRSRAGEGRGWAGRRAQGAKGG